MNICIRQLQQYGDRNDRDRGLLHEATRAAARERKTATTAENETSRSSGISKNRFLFYVIGRGPATTGPLLVCDGRAQGRPVVRTGEGHLALVRCIDELSHERK